MKTFLNIKNGLSQFLEPIYKFDKNILDSNIKDKLLVGTKYQESLTYLFQNLKMPGILTENSTNVRMASHELLAKIELLDKYTKMFNNQPLYFSSNFPAGIGDFNVCLQKQDQFITIYHQIKCRQSESAYSLEKIHNFLSRYNIEPGSDVTKKLCLDYSRLKDDKLIEFYLNLKTDQKLQKLIADDAFLIFDDSMEFDKMLNLLVGFELNPNIQPLLESHLTILS